MAESATTGTRERRMARTRAELVAEARRLTAEQGLAGFTVEQLCERVGVSRRTFFNYFPAKEDAVLGHPPEEGEEPLLAEFAAPRQDEGISPTLLADIVDVVVASLERHGHTAEEMARLRAALEREPQLLGRLVITGERRQRRLRELVAQREGISPDHPVAVAAVHAVMPLTREAADRYLAPGNDRPFRDHLLELLEGARALFGQPATHPGDDARRG